MIALGAAVLVAAVTAGCSPSTGWSPPTSADVLSTQRPGYPPNAEAVGDPAALVSEPGGAAVTYRGMPVVQACDLVTLEDIAAAGLTLRGGTASGLVRRNYLDGQGDARLPIEPGILVAEDNTCSYGILGEDAARPAGINVQVHQPSYVGKRAIDDELSDRHRRIADLGDVQVFEPVRPVAEFTARWMRYRDVYVEVLIDRVPDPQAQALLAALAERLPAVATNPTGPRRFDYRSPTFPVEYVNGCEISTADDFRALFRIEPSPSMKEGLSPGVGRMWFDTGVEANYVDHRCERHTPETFTDSSSLVVEVKTYDSVDAAASWFAFHRQRSAGIDTPTRLGDESITARLGEGLGMGPPQEAVVFRVGMAVVAVTLYDGPGNLTGDTHQELLPIATAIAARTPHRS
jgi:hypothetical protein